MKVCLIFICCSILFFTGCENTDLDLAAEAGLDALKAVTLSDEEVHTMAVAASKKSDAGHTIAPVASRHGRRLNRLVGKGWTDQGIRFNFRVYQSDTVNAFAMADGTIRIYSGLMEMMDDDELMFVVGHEMGHVIKKHIKKKIMLAYAASAVRKGVASQEGLAGDIARSGLGGLAQALLNAQFSQEEERQADDYGIYYLQQQGRPVTAAVSALNKLAGLGNNHSFLSSHPAPRDRAKRLQGQVDDPGKIGAPGVVEVLVEKIKIFIVEKLKTLQEG